MTSTPPVPEPRAAAPAPPGARGDAPPPDRTRLATLSLKISAVLYFIVAVIVALAPLAWDPATTDQYTLRSAIMGFLAVLALGLALLALWTLRGLRRRRRWAWRTALALFVLYLPSAFLPLGAVGLFGLLSAGTRESFARAREERLRG